MKNFFTAHLTLKFLSESQGLVGEAQIFYVKQEGNEDILFGCRCVTSQIEDPLHLSDNLLVDCCCDLDLVFIVSYKIFSIFIGK